MSAIQPIILLIVKLLYVRHLRRYKYYQKANYSFLYYFSIESGIKSMLGNNHMKFISGYRKRTKLIINMHKYIIEAEIINRPGQGKIIAIPRIIVIELL